MNRKKDWIILLFTALFCFGAAHGKSNGALSKQLLMSDLVDGISEIDTLVFGLVQIGDLGERSGDSPAVRDLGRRLANASIDTNKSIQRVMERKDLAFNREVVQRTDTEMTKQLTSLLPVSRFSFDRDFLSQTVIINNRIAKLSEKAVKHTADDDYLKLLGEIRENATKFRVEATDLQWPYQLDFPLHGRM